MISVYRANKTDIPGLVILFQEQDKMTFDPALINSRDISLVAYDENHAAVGFIWAGLMAKNTVAYVDKLLVAPGARSKGVYRELRKALFYEASKRGVKSCFAILRKDENYTKAAWGALKGALGSDGFDYTYVRGDVRKMTEDLNILGESYGR